MLAVYDPAGNYSQHAGVVITSIFENTHNPITIHLLHDNTLTNENKKNFIRTAEKYGQNIILHDVSDLTASFDTETISKTKCTIGALYRLFIPDILADVDKVLYIDCDVIVNLDIAELWNIDIKNYSLAGVHQAEFFESKDECIRDKFNGCDCKTYINAGIMIMNLEKIRSKGSLLENSLSWIKKHIHLMYFADQDILNSLFYGDIKLLDNKFNIAHSSVNNLYNADESFMRGKIIHTSGDDKTWDFTGMPVQKLYWRYYLNSAWGENTTTENFMITLHNIAEKNFREEDFKSSGHKNLIARVIYSLSWRIKQNTYFKICTIVLKELRYKLTSLFKN